MSSWSVVDRSIIRFHLDFEFEVMNSTLSLTLNPTIFNIIRWNDGLIVSSSDAPLSRYMVNKTVRDDCGLMDWS